MARRGEQLRDHILWTAKDVFIEMGFERTSMDVVAARAETSKRSLYAHFESKDKLFGAVIGLVRELYLGRLGTPAEYGEDPAEAAVAFCGRFLQLQLWTAALRTLRLGIAEAERLPEAAAEYHEAIFEIPQQRLATFLVERYGLGADAGREIAGQLMGRVIYPQLIRALLGLAEPLAERPDEATLADDVDLTPLRAAAAALLPPHDAAGPDR
ncbi:TetR/AcrR family transcriptional regulator [Streptantibioticus parmotrematis]|uniref:TetR/AcrR family transcriptional regulator n=1 Tax=Streptantibioticus parmotrematis TaxID=2873249 RepID=UPI0033C834CF